MGFYRKKPVVIEALRFDDVIFGANGQYNVFFDSTSALPEWMRKALIDEAIFPVSDDPPQLVIRTLEGEMLADKGDWIIKGVKNELYPCRPDIFAATYDPAPEPEQDFPAVAI